LGTLSGRRAVRVHGVTLLKYRKIRVSISGNGFSLLPRGIDSRQNNPQLLQGKPKIRNNQPMVKGKKQIEKRDEAIFVLPMYFFITVRPFPVYSVLQ